MPSEQTRTSNLRNVREPPMIFRWDITNERLFVVEVDSLLSDVREDELGVSGGTRGKKVDAYKQERALDGLVEDLQE